MIQKIGFSLLITAVFSIFTAGAQCVPDTTLKSSGYKPDTLEHARTWEPYTQTISVVTPKDTTVQFQGNSINVTVDSIKATGINGLPPGFNYACLHPRCVFVWKESRCMSISGTTNQAGIYFLQIPVVAYAKWGATPINRPDTIKRFNLVVNGSGGVNQIESSNEVGLKAYPNPTSGKVLIFHNRGLQLAELKLYDLRGKEQSVNMVKIPGGYSADIGSLKPGLYIARSGKWNCLIEKQL